MVIHATEYSIRSFEFCNQLSYIYLHPQNPHSLLQIATTSFAKIFQHFANKSNSFFFNEKLNSSYSKWITILTISSVSRPMVELHLHPKRRHASNQRSPSNRICWNNQMRVNVWVKSRRSRRSKDNKTARSHFHRKHRGLPMLVINELVGIRWISDIFPAIRDGLTAHREIRWYLSVCRTIGFLRAGSVFRAFSEHGRPIRSLQERSRMEIKERIGRF